MEGRRKGAGPGGGESSRKGSSTCKIIKARESLEVGRKSKILRGWIAQRRVAVNEMGEAVSCITLVMGVAFSSKGSDGF